MKKAPVLLMTYIRPKNTNFLLNLLFKFNQDKIFVFNDGLNNLVHKDLHQKTRKIILDFKKKMKIKIIFPKKNLTQRNNLPYALEKVFKNNDRVIILEDDCIPNYSFFKFSNLILEKYKDDNRISQVSGNNFLNFKKFKRRNRDSYFFSTLTSSWGWATWRNRWSNYYDKDIKMWPLIKNQSWLNDILHNDKSVKFWKKAFERRYKGLDDDWDRPWTFVNFINNRLNIFPNKNLISNIGDDNTALHSNPKKWNKLKLEKMKFPLNHPKFVIRDKQVDDFLTIEGFSTPKLSYRIKNKLKKYLFEKF
tara:strand:+ start:2597 stop:3514 length:918 start_codon:yes stop_codon:yes gene_type:complete